MGTKAKRGGGGFLTQGIILAAAGVVTKIIGVAYRVPLINIMGDKGQGYYSVAFQIYAIALLLTSYSLPLAVSKLVSARMAKGQAKNAFKVFKGALLFAALSGTAIGLVVYFGAGFIATNIMSVSMSVYALRVLAPGLVIVAIMGVMRGYFQGMGTMLPTAVSQIIEQVINAIISIIGASVLLQFGKRAAKAASEGKTLGPAYAAAGGTLGTVAGALAGLAFLLFVYCAFRKVMKRRMRHDRSRRQEGYGEIFGILILTIAPVIMSTAVYNISSVIDNAMFSQIMDVQGYSEAQYTTLLGIYGGKYDTLINVPLAIANALASSVIPSLTAAVQTGKKKLIHNKLYTASRFAMIIAIPSAVGYAVLAKPIVDLLFTSGDNEKAAMMLRLGAISVVFYCLSTVTNALLQGVNHMTAPVRNAAKALVIHLISLFVMLVMFKLNIYAVVLSKIVFSLAMCIFNSISLRKAVAYKQERKMTFAIPILASVIMGAVGFISYIVFDIFIGGRIATILALVLAMGSYGIGLLAMGGITSDEVLMLPKGATLLTFFKRMHLIKEEYY